MQLQGARVLLTGASSGIGAALAPRLAARGATVAVVARRRDRLEAVAERCRAYTPGSCALTADLAHLDDLESLVRRARDALGDVDCLVNNAGIPARIPVQRVTAADVTHVMDVNFHAPVRLTLALLPDWLAFGRGTVVNVSSMGGRIGIAREAAYCASKFALCGWSEAMAIDLYGTGVEVKLVLPGPIATEIWDQPGNERSVYDGPLVSSDDCAASIVDAMERPGFEFHVPPELPDELGSAHDVVVGKTSDPNAFLELMGQLAPREDGGA